MAELFEEVVALLESRSSTRALANRFRIESQQAAGNGVVLCVPILIAELSHLADDSVKSASLLKTLRSIDTFGLNDPGAAIEGNLYEPIGSKLTDTLLGDRRSSIVDLISAEAGIGRQSADCLLPPAAWTILTTVADRYGSRMGQQSLADVLAHEVDGLFNAGWGSWLEAVGTYGAEVQPDESYGGDLYDDRYGQPESDHDRYGMSEAHDTFGEYGQHELPTDGAYLQRTRYGDDERYGAVAGYGDYGQDLDSESSDDYSRYGVRGPGGVPAPEIARRSALEPGGGSVGLGSQRRSPSGPLIAERIPEEAAPSRIPLVLAAMAVALLGILAATQLIGGDNGTGTDGDGTTAAIDVGDAGDAGDAGDGDAR